MLTEKPCEHDEVARKHCSGFISEVEEKMSEMRPEHSAFFYHDILTLFEDACYAVWDEGGNGSTD